MQREPTPPALDDWLQCNVTGYRGGGSLEKFGFGQSNPTYLLRSADAKYVLRRQPFGTLLPRAHAIDREFRVLGALADSDVPTPRVYGYCAEAAVLGAPFYVMEYVEGRIFYDQRLPGMTAAERGAIYDGMNQAIARLHKVEPATAGLADYGRPDAFLERQITLWSSQYRACELEPLEAMERLIEWLPANLPPPQPPRIFHGDLRLDNLIFDRLQPRVLAILDWELSTLGDPLADFAYNAMTWRVGADVFRGVADIDLAALGIPVESDYVRRYIERSGLDPRGHWNFYLAFGLFRVAAILQGVRKRALDGNASAGDAEETGRRAAPLAALGWEIAQQVGS